MDFLDRVGDSVAKYKEKKTEDILRVEGVKAKGFGVVPKVVMRDRDLSVFAKAIYAYFCSLSGKGNSAFPGRDLILNSLKISKDAYYSGLKELTEQGYIVVEQENAGGRGVGFRRNVYTIVARPKKYANADDLDTDTVTLYQKIMRHGLDAAGYGIIPYAVMSDERIRSQPKAVYAYISSMVCSQHQIELDPNIIAYDLNVKELKTVQRAIKKLRELNYVDVARVHLDGRFAQNCYYINSTPDVDQAQHTIGCEVRSTQKGQKQDTQNQDSQNIQEGQKQDTQNGQDPQKQDGQKQDAQKQDVQKQDTNSNSNTSNCLTSNVFTSLIDRGIQDVKNKIGYDIMVTCNYGSREDDMVTLDALVNAVAEVLTTRETRVVIGGQPMLTDSVRLVVEQINNSAAINVLERFLARRSKIDPKSYKSYLLTAIYRELVNPTPNDDWDDDGDFGATSADEPIWVSDLC